MGDFLDNFDTADTSIDIAKSTADALIQAHNNERGYDSDDTVWVLMGIMNNLDTVRDCMNNMLDERKKLQATVEA